MVENARRVIICTMSNPDSAAPQSQPPPGQVVHAQSRLAGIGLAALFLGTVIVFVIAFIFVLETKQSTPGSPVSAANQDDVASLRARFASDEARLTTLEKGGAGDTLAIRSSLQRAQIDLAALYVRFGKLENAPDPQAAARLDDLGKQLAALRVDFDFRITALERNASSSDLPQRVAAMTTAQSVLDARVAKLERTDPAVTMRLAAAELALANLVRASGGSGPFVVELQTLRALMPDAAETAELAPISRKGAPARAELIARFPDVATLALAAESSGHAESWLGRLWSNMGNLIIVRRIGVARGSDSESILARAGARLNRGDLASAIAELKSLKGNARASVQPWLNDAQARLAIERDTSALADRMTKLLAPQ